MNTCFGKTIFDRMPHKLRVKFAGNVGFAQLKFAGNRNNMLAIVRNV